MKTIFTTVKQHKLLYFILVFLFSLNDVHSQTKHTIEVSNNKFTPYELKINVGDTIEWKNIQGWHNVNGTKATFPNNPESFGNNTGNGWTYRYVFNTQGKYDYQCDPHVSFGMSGKIEVEAANNDNKHALTINFSAMNPHVGQTLFLRVYEKNSGNEIERKTEDINANFTIQISDIEKEHSYYVDFFADHNGNGSYDAPNTDHAWRLELNNVTGDTTLNFSHNTNFTDIMWKNKLTVNFSGMNPHVGQNLVFRIVEKNSGIEIFNTQTTVSAEFSVLSYGLENGKSYHIDFYSDHNNNGNYDAPPADHAWRVALNNVSGDTIINFTHNINFTDIGIPTTIETLNKLVTKMYPNPASNKVTIELTGNLNDFSVSIFDISGKNYGTKKYLFTDKIELDISELNQGMFFIQLTENNSTQTFKLLKK